MADRSVDRDQAYLLTSLEQVRTRLLDRTRRNRLVNYKESARDIAIIDEMPDQVYEHLVQNSRPFAFDPYEGEEVDNESDAEEEISRTLPSSAHRTAGVDRRYTDDRLQTPFKRKDLERRLRRLYLNHRTIIQETGANNLYFAMGFLAWTDRDDEAKAQRSPLMLVPVRLEREGRAGAAVYRLVFDDEALDTNYSLYEKLKHSFDITLPLLEDENTPETYWGEVEKAIRHKTHDGWHIVREMSVGLFRFQKQVMWHDLDPSRWPAHSRITDKPLIRRILLGAKEGDSRPGQLIEEYDQDDPEGLKGLPKLQLIRDVDSSQHSALVDALAREDGLVIEGPPGTGKSQTITNLIAAALADGKSVLFVAEKMAALEVVHKRLQDSKLGDFCLQLHGLKTNKKELLNSITSRRRRSAQRPRELKRKESELVAVRKELIELSAALSTPVGPEGLPLYDITWRVERLRQSLPDDFNSVDIEDPEALSRSAFDRAKRLVSDLGREWDSIPESARIAWAGFRPEIYREANEREMAASLSECIKNLRFAREWLDDAGLSKQAPALQGISQLRSFAGQNAEEMLPRLPAGIGQELVRAVVVSGQLDEFEELLSELDRYVEGVTAINRVFDYAAEESQQHAATLGHHATLLSGIACSPETQIGSLPDERSLLQVALEHLEAIDRHASPVLALTGGFARTLSDYKNLADKAAQLCSGPKDLTFHATPAHSSTNSKSYLKEAQSQSNALHERAAALSAFDLVQDTDSKVIRWAFSAIDARTDSWIPILSSEYRKARKFVRSLMKRASVYERTPKFLSQLRSLPDYLDDLEKFRKNSDLKQALGTLFSGAQTDWGRLEAAVDFSQELREEVGLEVARSILEDWNAHMDRMEVARDHITRSLEISREFQEVHPFPASLWQRPVGEIVNTLTPWIGKLDAAIQAICQPWCSFSTSLSEAIETVDRHRRARERESTIERHRGFQTIRPYWECSQTPIDQLHDSYDWIDERLSNRGIDLDLLKLLLPAPGEINNELLAELVEQAGHVATALENQIRRLQKIGTVDEEGWQRGPEATLTDVIVKHEGCLSTLSSLPLMVRWQLVHSQVCEIGLESISNAISVSELSGDQASDAFEFSVYSTLLENQINKTPALAGFSHERAESLREWFAGVDREVFKLTADSIAADLCRAPVPEGVAYGPVRERTEDSLLRHEEGKKKRHIPVRQLTRRAGNALQALKPCFLMSPLSVAQFLAPGEIEFDFVVMDEASQIRPEDALGAIARARKVIIVGDPKQLPPTSFFDTAIAEDEDAEETIVEDTESILDVCLKQFPFRRLRWHYRSQHEDLIRFSNEQFYENDLIVFPSPKGSSREYGVHSSYIDAPTYRAGRNLAEARVVVENIINQLRANPDTTLGVAAFNKRQAEEIQLLLDKAAREDPSIDELITNLDGEEPFFIKNLENVQGDERDVIFISTTYGPERTGGPVHQRFGPINSDTGWRRLNVIATRARKRVEVFTSMRPTDVIVGDGARRGVRALRSYLEYAETGRVSDLGRKTGGAPDSEFEISVGAIVDQLGYQTEPQVGVEGFFIDIGVCHPDRPGEYLMGIECDGAAYHSSRSVRDRDRLRQEILEDKGWHIHRIWSTSWFHTRSAEIDRLRRAIESQLAADRAVSQPRREAVVVSTALPDTDETLLAVEEAESLSHALERFWSQNIEPQFSDRSRSILSGPMVALLIQQRPSTEEEWFSAVPMNVRQHIEPGERDFLDDVLDVIAECG